MVRRPYVQCVINESHCAEITAAVVAFKATIQMRWAANWPPPGLLAPAADELEP